MNKEDFETQCKLLCEDCSNNVSVVFFSKASPSFWHYEFDKKYDIYPHYLSCYASSLRELYAK